MPQKVSDDTLKEQVFTLLKAYFTGYYTCLFKDVDEDKLNYAPLDQMISDYVSCALTLSEEDYYESRYSYKKDKTRGAMEIAEDIVNNYSVYDNFCSMKYAVLKKLVEDRFGDKEVEYTIFDLLSSATTYPVSLSEGSYHKGKSEAYKVIGYLADGDLAKQTLDDSSYKYTTDRVYEGYSKAVEYVSALYDLYSID